MKNKRNLCCELGLADDKVSDKTYPTLSPHVGS